ncbi:MAG: hypothetical protein K6F09_07855 [Clostridiales bacterium]|nr:hypothetical protein [Clostridiales bacterium]
MSVKKIFAVVLATLIMAICSFAIVSVSAKDPYYSPSPTVIPEGPTGITGPSNPEGPTGVTGPSNPSVTTPGGTTSPGGGTTKPGGGTTKPGQTTTKPGQTTTKPGQSGTSAPGGTSGTNVEGSTAKPDKNPSSPKTGSAEKFLGAAIILTGTMTAIVIVPTKKKADCAD